MSKEIQCTDPVENSNQNINVYVAGYEGNVARYWKKGNPVSLTAITEL
jgi:hypothetical protein